MRWGLWVRVASVGLFLGTALAIPYPTQSQQAGGRYEVWAIDQADAARGGSRLYIFDGQRLEVGQPGAPEVVDLDAAARGVGDGPGVRPHMVEFNSRFSHAIIANVASGHVYVLRARDRRVVASIDVGEQAHHAVASPDDAMILVANQNGKRLARIRADFVAERFTHDRADDLILGALEDTAHPDNAPLCPVVSGTKTYIIPRGGGLYVVDHRSTPMRVLRTYGRETVAPAGCGGVFIGNKLYINSGTTVSSDLYVLDSTSDALLKHLRLAWAGADGHGLVATGGGRFLWMGNRADHNIVVINTARDVFAGLITGVGVAPDVLGISPSGTHAYVSLRGPNNLTGGPSAKGATPGVAVLEVIDEGRGGRRIGFVPIGDQTPASPNDPHALAVRPGR